MTLLRNSNSNSGKSFTAKKRRGRPPASSKLAFPLPSQRLSNPPSTFSCSSSLSVENFNSISSNTTPSTCSQPELGTNSDNFSFFSDLKDTGMWPDTSFAPAPSLLSEIQSLCFPGVSPAFQSSNEAQQRFAQPVRSAAKAQAADKRRTKKKSGFATDFPASKRRQVNPHVTWSNPELNSFNENFFAMDLASNFDGSGHLYPFSEPNPDDHTTFSLLDTLNASQELSLSDPVLPSTIPDSFNCRVLTPPLRQVEQAPFKVSIPHHRPSEKVKYAASSPIFHDAAQAAADFYGNLVLGNSTDQTTESIYKS